MTTLPSGIFLHKTDPGFLPPFKSPGLIFILYFLFKALVARQLLVFNRIIEPTETIKNIDLVSRETVQNIAKKIVTGPITISSIGPLSNLENLDKIQSRLN